MLVVNPLELARHIEHTLLRASATERDIRALCTQALTSSFFGAVVNPVWVPLASELLAGSSTAVITVVGFPLGANRTSIKEAEAVASIEDGANEIDMVANIGWLCDNRFHDVESEIIALRHTLPSEIPLKVIIETPLLNETQLRESVKLIKNAGAQFVKTCTGFGGPATIEHVRTIVSASAGAVRVKASGGIQTFAHACAFIEAGASRIGSSSSVEIMAQAQAAHKSGSTS